MSSACPRPTIASAPAHRLGLLVGAVLLVACAAPTAAPKATAPVATAPAAATSAPVAQAVPTQAAPTQPPAPATVKAGLMLSASDTGFFVGIEQGYFAEQGITVDVTPIQAAATMLAPLAASQID